MENSDIIVGECDESSSITLMHQQRDQEAEV